MFGEDVDDDEKEAKVEETIIPSSTEPVTPESTSTTTESLFPTAPTESSPSPSTETLKEAPQIFGFPEEFSTSPPELTSEATSAAPATTVAPIQIPVTEITLLTNEVFTHATSSEAPKFVPVTQEAATQAILTPTVHDENVFPTEFDKLLTTLREFVAKAEAIRPPSALRPLPENLKPVEEAPPTVVEAMQSVPEIPQVEQQVEFVNYTVSSEKHEEEDPHHIVKRSIRDADLVPVYYKRNFFSNKEKACIFNGNSYKIGEAIKTDNECLKCICEYAPIGHCLLKEKCNL